MIQTPPSYPRQRSWTARPPDSLLTSCSVRFGFELRDWRLTIDLSQGALATALGMSVATLKRYEAGPLLPRYLQLAIEALARRLAQKTRS